MATSRISRASTQASLLSNMDDDALGRLVDRSQVNGWGASATASLADGSLVFVKRLPLTDLERARPHSTRNHFQLPVRYQYGVGSAGFGAWRELAAHQTTTAWVQGGECDRFPMLLHHRVMTRPTKRQTTAKTDWIETPDYVRYWNGSKRIGEFIKARAATQFELWLVLEHVPHRMSDWFIDNQPDAPRILDAQLATIRFLHDHGMFHFDSHYRNVVTDGSTPLLTDFGLATDRSFDLSPREHQFLDGHRHYDFGETVFGVGSSVFELLLRLPPEQQQEVLARVGVDATTKRGPLLNALLANVDTLDADGLLPSSSDLRDLVHRFMPVIRFMSDFFSDMNYNRRKDTFFDDERLGRLLAEVGVSGS